MCNVVYVIDEKRHICRFEGTFEDYKRYSLRNYKHFDNFQVENKYPCLLNTI